jgi:hypothetical protein
MPTLTYTWPDGTGASSDWSPSRPQLERWHTPYERWFLPNARGWSTAEHANAVIQSIPVFREATRGRRFWISFKLGSPRTRHRRQIGVWSRQKVLRVRVTTFTSTHQAMCLVPDPRRLRSNARCRRHRPVGGNLEIVDPGRHTDPEQHHTILHANLGAH